MSVSNILENGKIASQYLPGAVVAQYRNSTYTIPNEAINENANEFHEFDLTGNNPANNKFDITLTLTGNIVGDPGAEDIQYWISEVFDGAYDPARCIGTFSVNFPGNTGTVSVVDYRFTYFASTGNITALHLIQDKPGAGIVAWTDGTLTANIVASVCNPMV